MDLITEIPSNFKALIDHVERGSFKHGSNILKRPALPDQNHSPSHSTSPRSLFNGFGSNLAKDVTSYARKKFSVPTGRNRVLGRGDDANNKSAMNREEYRRRKVTSVYKTQATSDTKKYILNLLL